MASRIKFWKHGMVCMSGCNSCTQGLWPWVSWERNPELYRPNVSLIDRFSRFKYGYKSGDTVIYLDKILNDKIANVI